MTSQREVPPAPSRSFGLKVDCAPTVVESNGEMRIRVVCAYLPPVPGTISIVILDSLDQVIQECNLATRAVTGEQGVISVTLDQAHPADQYTVRATIVGTRIYSFAYFYISNSAVSSAEASIDAALDFRSEASAFLKAGNVGRAITSLEHCAPEFARGHWYDCAAYAYRDVALLSEGCGDRDVARISASKALLYLLLAEDPISSGTFKSRMLTTEAVAPLISLIDCGFPGDNLEDIDLHSSILRSLARSDPEDPLLLEVMERHAHIPALAAHAIELLSLLDPDRALENLQLIGRESAWNDIGSELDTPLRSLLELLGPRRAYIFINEITRPPTPTDQRIIDILESIYSFAFDEVDGGDTCYVARLDSTDDPETIATNREFIQRVLGTTTFGEARQQVGVVR